MLSDLLSQLLSLLVYCHVFLNNRDYRRLRLLCYICVWLLHAWILLQVIFPFVRAADLSNLILAQVLQSFFLIFRQHLVKLRTGYALPSSKGKTVMPQWTLFTHTLFRTVLVEKAERGYFYLGGCTFSLNKDVLVSHLAHIDGNV